MDAGGEDKAPRVLIRPVVFESISNEDLQWIAKADSLGHDRRPALSYIVSIHSGEMRLWRFSGAAEGVLITSQSTRVLWIEMLVGRGLATYARSLAPAIRALEPMLSVKCAVSKPQLERIYKRLGFAPVATIMEAI